jgi:hypothetical protein
MVVWANNVARRMPKPGQTEPTRKSLELAQAERETARMCDTLCLVLRTPVEKLSHLLRWRCPRVLFTFQLIGRRQRKRAFWFVMPSRG